MQHLKKSKITLLLKIISTIALILGIINVILNYNSSPKSKYNINTKEITGTITNCIKTTYNYQITIKAKENVIINYQKDFKCKLGIKIKATGIKHFVRQNSNRFLFYARIDEEHDSFAATIFFQYERIMTRFSEAHASHVGGQ